MIIRFLLPLIFDCPTGTKFVLLTSLAETVADTVLQKIYDIYADAVMKNPFHTPEMPIRNEGFDARINSLIGTGQTYEPSSNLFTNDNALPACILRTPRRKRMSDDERKK
jgi:hypothetical protein